MLCVLNLFGEKRNIMISILENPCKGTSDILYVLWINHCACVGLSLLIAKWVADNSLWGSVEELLLLRKVLILFLLTLGNSKELWNRSFQETPCTHKAVTIVCCKPRYKFETSKLCNNMRTWAWDTLNEFKFYLHGIWLPCIFIC